MRFAAALSEATGSQGLMPRPAAVLGSNCAMPSAPAGDLALALNPLSRLIWRTKVCGSMPAAVASCSASTTYWLLGTCMAPLFGVTMAENPSVSPLPIHHEVNCVREVDVRFHAEESATRTLLASPPRTTSRRPPA